MAEDYSLLVDFKDYSYCNSKQMHLYIRFLLFLFLLLTSTQLYSASQTQLADLTEEERDYIKNSPPVRVHNETSWPPFNFYDNSLPQGISIDVMNRIAELTGLRLEYITGPSWDQFMQMADENQLDVMLNIVKLPERRGQFYFTTPYAKSLSGVFTIKREQQRIFELSDLEGKTLAIPKGFDLEIILSQAYPEINLLPVTSIIECIEAVHSGSADAFMEEIGVVDYITAQKMVSDIHMAFMVNDERFISDLRIGVARQYKLLYSIIQKGLNNIPAEELNAIRKKWLLQTNMLYEQSMVNLSVSEKQYLFANNSVNICVDPTWAPLDFIDENGKHSGLSADLINKVATRVGVTLNLIKTTTWEQSLQFVQQGRCDVIPLLNQTEENSAYLNFSQPYFNFPTIIASRKEASFIGGYTDLYGKKVALQRFFFITEYVKQHHPQIEVVEVENTQEALKLVASKDVYATIDGLPNVVNTIETLALENIEIVGSVPQENQMKLGAAADKPVLLSIFSKAIASLSEREKIGLYKKWFDIEVSNQFLNKKLLIQIAALSILLILFLLWRQFTLGKHARQLRTLNTKLKYSSTVDHLTKISNRRSIEKALNTECKIAALSEQPLTVVIFDIDHFKQVNDIHGHLSGDRVLEEMATLVKASIRRTDHFGRWGGEEFLLILPGTRQLEGKQLVTKIKDKIEQYDFRINKTVTASFGLGEYQPSENITKLLSRIDTGLYNAKMQGRNSIVTAEKQ